MRKLVLEKQLYRLYYRSGPYSDPVYSEPLTLPAWMFIDDYDLTTA